MNLNIDNIFHTILLGHTTLCILILTIFLLFGYGPFPKITYFLKKGLYRDPNNIESNNANTYDYYSNTASYDSNKKESYYNKWLIGLLFFATAYCAGITVENIFDQSHESHENYYKVEAYEQILSKHDLEPHKMVAGRIEAIERFYHKSNNKVRFNEDINLQTIFEASIDRIFNNSPDNDYKEIDKNIFYTYNELLETHVKPAYHEARNNAAQNNNYPTSLEKIQTRITFTRGMKEILRYGSILIFFCITLKFILYITEFIFHHKKLSWIKALERDYHHKKLSWIKAIVLFMVLFIAFLFIRTTWVREENQFNKRVYAFGVTKKIIADKPEEVSELNVFCNKQVDKFEPSGVARLGIGNKFLVVNDKGHELNNNHFSIYSLNQNCFEWKFTLEKKLVLKKKRCCCPVDIYDNEYLKIEGLCRSNLHSNDDTNVFYAITSHSKDDDKNKKLLKLTYKQLDKYKLSDNDNLFVEELKFDISSIISKDNYIRIEAIAEVDDNKLLIGVRERGSDKENTKYVCELYLHSINEKKSEKWASFNTGRNEGLSGIFLKKYHEKAKDKPLYKLYLLTSIEHRDFVSKKAEVSGNIYEYMFDNLDFIPNYENLDIRCFFTRTFNSKPEGITIFDDKRDKYKLPSDDKRDKYKLLIVFDTDGYRKKTGDPLYFPIHKCDDYFTVIEN